LTTVKVLDFGLAKLVPKALREQSAPTLTRAGSIVGTRGYMAPEQLAGGKVDERADVFALGIMLLEALTGRNPLRDPRGSGYSGLEWGEGLHWDASGDTAALNVYLRLCLACDPGERIASVAAMQGVLIPLLRVLEPQPGSASPRIPSTASTPSTTTNA